MKYVKKGECYYAMTEEQFSSGRKYEYTIEAVREPTKMRLRGYEVYNYEGTKRLTHSNGNVYFHSLKAAKEAVFDAYHARVFEEKFNAIGAE